MKLKKFVRKIFTENYIQFNGGVDAVMYLYCCLGNGIEWDVDGSLCYGSNKKCNLKFDFSRTLTFMHPISSHSIVSKIPENVKQDYLDAAFLVLDVAILSGHPHSYVGSIEDNREAAKKIRDDLDKRFPGRLSIRGIRVPKRVYPSAYNCRQDLLLFNIGDTVRVTFGSGYRVPAKYKNKTIDFIINNACECQWRIKSKTLVLVACDKESDVIVVHSTDRFECLMIDLFPCNRRAFDGWKNKEILIKKT